MSGVKTVETDPNGFIWVKLDQSYFNLDTDVFICFVYIPPCDSVYFKLHETDFFSQLESGIRKYSEAGSVSVIGDLNARTSTNDDFAQSSDDYINFLPTLNDDDFVIDDFQNRCSEDKICNSSGQKLLDICKSTDLRIINGRVGDDRGVGRLTFLSSTGKSLIDYAIHCFQ